MKYIFLSILILLLPLGLLHAQEKAQVKDKREQYSKNEIYLNPVGYLLGNFNAYYERSISQKSAVGFGASASAFELKFINFIALRIQSIRQPFSFTSYYRHYFGKHTNMGFYTEVYARYTSYVVTEFASGVAAKKEGFKGSFLGTGIGWKTVNKKGVTFQLGLGLGRNLTHPEDLDIFPKGTLAVGYRL